MDRGLLHDNEILLNVGIVRNLVDNAFPRYASLPLSRLGASGSTNVLFRLGDELLVRLPRQSGGVNTQYLRRRIRLFLHRKFTVLLKFSIKPC